MREEQARIIVSFAVAVALETDAVIDYAETRGREWVKQVRCVEEVDMGLEVTAIEMPDTEVKHLYEMQNKDQVSKFDLRPPGKLVCKPWKVPDFKQYDLPSECSTTRDISQPKFVQLTTFTSCTRTT